MDTKRPKNEAELYRMAERFMKKDGGASGVDPALWAGMRRARYISEVLSDDPEMRRPVEEFLADLKKAHEFLEAGIFRTPWSESSVTWNGDEEGDQPRKGDAGSSAGSGDLGEINALSEYLSAQFWTEPDVRQFRERHMPWWPLPWNVDTGWYAAWRRGGAEPGPVVAELGHLLASLVQRYPWSEWQAYDLLLHGGIQSVTGIAATPQTFVSSVCRLTRIRLELDARSDAESVLKIVRIIQKQQLGRQIVHTPPKQLEVFRFVTAHRRENPTMTLAEAYRRWESAGRQGYNIHSFSKAYTKAHARLTGLTARRKTGR